MGCNFHRAFLLFCSNFALWGKPGKIDFSIFAGKGFSPKTPFFFLIIFCVLKEVKGFGGWGGVGGWEGWAGGRGGDRGVSPLPPSGGPIFDFEVPQRFVEAM